MYSVVLQLHNQGVSYNDRRSTLNFIYSPTLEAVLISAIIAFVAFINLAPAPSPRGPRPISECLAVQVASAFWLIKKK
jgi:hypothetical protein